MLAVSSLQNVITEIQKFIQCHDKAQNHENCNVIGNTKYKTQKKPVIDIFNSKI